MHIHMGQVHSKVEKYLPVEHRIPLKVQVFKNLLFFVRVYCVVGMLLKKSFVYQIFNNSLYHII